LTDHSAHLQQPAVLAAARAREDHVASCAQCQAAPGPPPPDCPPIQRSLYACEEGLRLHEAQVVAANDAYGEARRG
jgi:hypothetical protein